MGSLRSTFIHAAVNTSAATETVSTSTSADLPSSRETITLIFRRPFWGSKSVPYVQKWEVNKIVPYLLPTQ